jgi:hypothetical protein
MSAVVTAGMRSVKTLVKGGGCIVRAARTWTTFRAARIPPKNTIKPEREATFIAIVICEEKEVFVKFNLQSVSGVE